MFEHTGAFSSLLNTFLNASSALCPSISPSGGSLRVCADPITHLQREPRFGSHQNETVGLHISNTWM